MGGFKLLTVGNPKIEKGIAKGYLTAVLHLAPGKLSGFQVCPKATDGCLAACLNTAGRGGIAKGGNLDYAALLAGKRNVIQEARIRRTRWYFEDRPAFMAALVADIHKLVKLAAKHGLKPAVRLNGTSDIPWERVAVAGAANVMALFPTLQFYDYTKRGNRSALPANYRLTFSLAENNDADALAVLARGGNVAAVFRSKTLPATWNGYRVIDGDESDLRFLDPAGCVVGLYAKGNAKRDQSGFVRD